MTDFISPVGKVTNFIPDQNMQNIFRNLGIVNTGKRKYKAISKRLINFLKEYKNWLTSNNLWMTEADKGNKCHLTRIHYKQL